MLIGYARCSTEDQDLTAQRARLLVLGAEQTFTDHGQSGATRDRPGLYAALGALRTGDSLLVPALDRLGRSVTDLRAIADELAERGVALNVGGTVYDPTDPFGRMFFTILAAFAEFERELLRARTREGMATARAAGRLNGRAPKLTAARRRHLDQLWASGEHTVTDLAELFEVSRATVYREIRRTFA